MTNIPFKHNDSDVCHDNTLTLHDCVADKVSVFNNTLRFTFPDGLWVTPLHEDNTSDKTLKTDAAVVDFCVENIDNIKVHTFTRTLFGKTKVETWNIHILMNAINNGECTIEFITQYRAHFEQMWLCVLHSKKKPYYRECQLHLPGTEATFRWNDIQLEREW